MADPRLKKLPEVLLPWYRANCRQLPWRQDRQAYHVWLSEIMLQQTRVEAVKGYYTRFLKALPDIKALAACDDDALHKLWEGLGYYSRVRNLKKAAGQIMERHGGQFPGEYEAIRALPGIGEYTAGAICSICFDQPTPAVDGNVLRVIARITNDPTPIDLPQYKRQVKEALAEVYPEAAGDFTQALMELGATVCGPNRAPDCDSCPCKDFCLACQQGTAKQLPVKSPKKGRRQQELTVFIFRCAQRYAIEKRGDTGLLAGLWQFPNVPGTLDAQQAVDTAQAMGVRPSGVHLCLDKSHIFTHIQWQLRGYYIEAMVPKETLCWLTEQEIEAEAALPTAFRQFWQARQEF